MKLTTTLNLLREHDACAPGFKRLINHVGEDYGGDKPINLLTILESNGVSHFFWATRATEQNFIDVKPTLINIVCDIAESVLHIFESEHPGKSHPRNAIEAARRVAENDTEENRMAAKSAVYAVYAPAKSGDYATVKSASYAYAAAKSAAYASASPDADADDASDAAARSAASAASGAPEEIEKQKGIIKKYLSIGD